jgi:bifunctional UDP-N-acetylglucosamine pyrophosphorylase/glucosamine-1-phosphate N-acetyltransferase
MGRRDLHVVVLAAGLGKRMRSSVVKVLHPVAGRPMIAWPLAAAAALRPRSIVVVVGNQADAVRAAVEREAAALGLRGARLRIARQARQLGTGHALLQAERALRGARGDLLILSGDVPAILPDTLRRLLRRHRAAGAAATLLTAELPDPTGYGRIVREDGAGRDDVVRIVEHADATPSERAIREVNAGIYVTDARRVFGAVRGAGRGNAQREHYLTDMVGAFRKKGRRVVAVRHGDPEEVMGVNDRRELARAGRRLVERALDRLMRGGVTVVDPSRTEVEPGVQVGRDTVIHPGVTLRGRTRVGERCELFPGSRLQDAVVGPGSVVLDHCLVVESRLGAGVRIGPMAHLRPGTVLGDETRIGNFVETKKARLGRGSKANHLTYLGDARIGRDVNVGAGTITCNYDGIRKHTTVLEDGVFIGSDTQLVAPVKVGRGSYVGAGSTITRDVPAGALALSRARQVNKEGWAEARRRARGKARRGG